MSIVKRDSFRKTLIALGAAAVMGGAAASANPAVAVCGPCRPSFARSPGSINNPAVATNPCGPRAAANPCNSGAARNPRGAKNPPAIENPGAEVDPWRSYYVDS